VVDEEAAELATPYNPGEGSASLAPAASTSATMRESKILDMNMARERPTLSINPDDTADSHNPLSPETSRMVISALVKHQQLHSPSGDRRDADHEEDAGGLPMPSAGKLPPIYNPEWLSQREAELQAGSTGPPSLSGSGAATGTSEASDPFRTPTEKEQ
jgi:hypothetical protein